MFKALLILKYFKFLYRSKSLYKIHSPFIYEFISFIKSNKKLDFNSLSNISNSLKTDNRIINIIDNGAGSKYSKKNTQKIKDIYFRASKSKKQLAFISNLNKFLKADNFIELGTSLGLTSAFVKINNPKTNIITIEGDKQIFDISEENFKKLNLQVNSINDIFDNVLENIIVENQNLKNLFFLDGNHTKKATLKYFNLIKKHSNKNTVIIFDDIRWSKEMMQAWDEISADDYVYVSLDFFSIGLTFFNKDITKQHHLIRHFL